MTAVMFRLKLPINNGSLASSSLSLSDGGPAHLRGRIHSVSADKDSAVSVLYGTHGQRQGGCYCRIFTADQPSRAAYDHILSVHSSQTPPRSYGIMTERAMLGRAPENASANENCSASRQVNEAMTRPYL